MRWLKAVSTVMAARVRSSAVRLTVASTFSRSFCDKAICLLASVMFFSVYPCQCSGVMSLQHKK
jgi:hypothetical protein